MVPDLVQATGFIAGTHSGWPELQSLAAGNTAFLQDPRNWPGFGPGVDVAGSDLDAFFASVEELLHEIYHTGS